jgi:hypothetical protein
VVGYRLHRARYSFVGGTAHPIQCDLARVAQRNLESSVSTHDLCPTLRPYNVVVPLTEREQQAPEQMRKAQEHGSTLKDCAAKIGLDVRQLYELRRRFVRNGAFGAAPAPQGQELPQGRRVFARARRACGADSEQYVGHVLPGASARLGARVRRITAGLVDRGGVLPPTIQPLDQARYSVPMERIESTNADRIAWCCQQFGITPYEPATEIGISEKTMDRAMAGEAALTFAQKGLDARWAHVI